MKVIFEETDMRPLVERVVAETIERIESHREQLDGRLAFPEAEAASLLGVERHVLRDARLRGELQGARVGKRIVYSRQQLLSFLNRNLAD
jgi:hypothetical protein